MIKVLFLIHDLSMGGAEKVLVNLVNNMDSSKFDITVISLFGGGVNEKFLKPHIKYKAIFKKTIRGNSKLMKLFTPQMLHKFFIKDTYDIEISYLEGPCSRIISGCTNSSTKLVSWVHSTIKTKKNSAHSFRSFKESQICYGRFDYIVCVSESVKQSFQILYSNLKGIKVLYNTNETEQIVQLSCEDIEDGVFDSKEFNIIAAGKIVKIKGFDRLAHIQKKLRNQGYSSHCYILGLGNQQSEIEKYIEENNLSDSFTFMGYQTNPYKYISKADLFVCSSYSEGFSTAVTEALIVGTPVVTTDVSGMREMLGEKNEYGIITSNDEDSLYNSIKELMDNPELLKLYRQKALIRGKDFSTRNTVNSVEQMLFKLK